MSRASRLAVVGFTILCGSVSLIYPFGRDQGNYGYAGWVLLEGGVPYRDVFVFKPPMTVVVHGLAMGLFGVNTWAIRAFDVGWTAASALVVAAIAFELWGRRDAALGAGLLYPFLYYQIDYWTIAQTDGWMTLPCAAAVWTTLRGGRWVERDMRRAVSWWIGAGMLAGVAVLFKYTAGLIGLPMLMALGWVGTGAERRVFGAGIAAMIAGGTLTLAACVIWLVGSGAWSAFVDTQLGLVATYAERGTRPGTLWEVLVRLFTLKRTKTDLVPLVLTGPIFAVPAVWSLRPFARRHRWAVALALTWWLAAIGNVLVQRKFFDYHYLPLLAPAALLGGLGLAALLEHVLSRIARPALRVAAVAALAAAAVALTPLGDKARDLARVLGPQTVDDYIASQRQYAYPAYNVAEIRRVAEVLRETTTPDQRVFLWGFEPTINVRARRHTVGRFLYNFPFRMSWGNPRYEAELMEALVARPPDVFVVASGDRYPGLTGTYKDSAALLRDFEALDAFVQSRYTPGEKIGRYALWRLQK